jgi:hypothetical protein
MSGPPRKVPPAPANHRPPAAPRRPLLLPHLHLASHELDELREVDGAIAICIYLVDHVLQLGFRGVLPQRPHDRAQLLGGDGALHPGGGGGSSAGCAFDTTVPAAGQGRGRVGGQ